MTPPPAFDPRARASYRDFTPVTVRFADLDTLGHVNNIAINAYVEQARVLYWMPLLQRFGNERMDTVVVRVAVDYLAEIGFPGSVEVGARLARIGNTSLTLINPVFSGATCHAVGESVAVLFDRIERRAMPPPPAMRAELERLLREG